MPTLEEILASLEDEDAAVLRQALAAKDKTAATAKRDLDLLSDPDLSKSFPRAWRNHQKKKWDLGDAMSKEEVREKFRLMEAEYTELGVPISETPSAQPTAGTVPAGAVPDPAAAFGTGVGGGAAPGAARDLEQEFREAMKSEDPGDRVRLIELVDDMDGEQRNRLVDTLATPDSPLMRRSRGF